MAPAPLATPMAFPGPLTNEDLEDLSSVITDPWADPYNHYSLSTSVVESSSSSPSFQSTWNTPSPAARLPTINQPATPESAAPSSEVTGPNPISTASTLQETEINSSPILNGWSAPINPTSLWQSSPGTPLPARTLTWTPYVPDRSSSLVSLSPSYATLHTNQDFYRYIILGSVGGSVLVILLILCWCGCSAASRNSRAEKEKRKREEEERKKREEEEEKKKKEEEEEMKAWRRRGGGMHGCPVINYYG